MRCASGRRILRLDLRFLAAAGSVSLAGLGIGSASEQVLLWACRLYVEPPATRTRSWEVRTPSQTHGGRAGRSLALPRRPRSRAVWRAPHARVARLSVESGETDGSTTRRKAVGEWAIETASWAIRTVATLGAAAVAFYAGAKVAVIGQPTLPGLPPASAEAVGSEVTMIAGLRCRVLYPARRPGEGAAAAEAPYLTEGTGTSDAMARLVFFPGFLLEHLGYASSGCLKGMPPDAVGGPSGYPVLVYSHGQGGNMDMGTYFLRAIASYGVVVVAIEHQDGSASTADTQNPRPFSLARGQRGVRARAAEAIQVADALKEPSGAAGSAALAERWGGDAGSILVGGHSYGGPTALIAAAERPELFQGLVLHDPATTDSPQPPQPVFSVVGDQYVNIAPLAKEVRRVSTGQVSPEESAAKPGLAWAGAWHYEGVSHGNFVDAPLWAPLLIMRALGLILIPAAGPAEPAEAHARLAMAAASFAAACSGRSPAWAAASSVRALPEAPFVRL